MTEILDEPPSLMHGSYWLPLPSELEDLFVGCDRIMWRVNHKTHTVELLGFDIPL